VQFWYHDDDNGDDENSCNVWAETRSWSDRTTQGSRMQFNKEIDNETLHGIKRSPVLTMRHPL
jgi:hypothetical protein